MKAPGIYELMFLAVTYMYSVKAILKAMCQEFNTHTHKASWGLGVLPQKKKKREGGDDENDHKLKHFTITLG